MLSHEFVGYRLVALMRVPYLNDIIVSWCLSLASPCCRTVAVLSWPTASSHVVQCHIELDQIVLLQVGSGRVAD